MKRKLRHLILASLATVIAVPTITFNLKMIEESISKRTKEAVAASLDAFYANVDDSSASKLHASLHNLLSPKVFTSYDALKEYYAVAYTKNHQGSKLFDYYSNASNFSATSGACGSYSDEGDCWNREHSIPKSWWGGKPDKSNQGADPFMVIPSDGYVNNRRGNYQLGNVGSVTYSSINGYSKLGNSDGTGGSSGIVFEPNDAVKGDLARIYFYAATKYDCSNWTSGNNMFADTQFYLTSYSKTLLKEWHHNDPVDEWERTMNEKLFSISEIGISNPFVYNPNWADVIWFDGTSTSTKTLNSISISGSLKTTSYIEGDAFNPQGLTVTATYSDNSTKDVTNLVTWTPNPLTKGITSVTATYVEGGVTRTATYNGITVSEKAQGITLTALSLGGSLNKKTYYVGENFDPTGLIVQAVYSDGSIATVTNQVVWTPNPLTYGTTKVVGTYEGKSVEVTGITVKQTEITEGTAVFDFTNMGLTSNSQLSFNIDPISVVFDKSESNAPVAVFNTSDNKIRFYWGDKVIISSSVNITGIVFEYEDSKNSEPLSCSSGTLNGKTWTGEANEVTFVVPGSSGHKKLSKITVTYASSSGSTDPVESVLESLTVTTTKSSYYVGESLDLSTLTANAKYTDKTIKLNTSDLIIDGDEECFTYSDSEKGYKTISFSYTDKLTVTTSIKINVSRKAYQTLSGETYSITKSTFNGKIGTSNSTTTTGQVTANSESPVGQIDYYLKNGYIYNSYLSLRRGSDKGYLYNITAYPYDIKSINVTCSITGKLYISKNGSTWENYDETKLSSSSYKYFKYSFEDSTSGSYVNITSIAINFKGEETAKNVANFIMYTDTQNQCVTKFSEAKQKILSLSSSELEIFKTSNDYVIKEARNRYEAWAKNQNQDPYSNSSTLRGPVLTKYFNDSNQLIILITILFSSIALVSLFIKLRKKDEK